MTLLFFFVITPFVNKGVAFHFPVIRDIIFPDIRFSVSPSPGSPDFRMGVVENSVFSKNVIPAKAGIQCFQ